MRTLNDVQNSYMSSLKTLTTSANNRKLAAEKKDDELTGWKKKEYNFDEEKAVARQMFPVTTNIFYLSFLLWVCIALICYYVISYGMMYARIKQESDIDGPCKETFSTVKEENMKKIANYSVGDAAAYVARLKPPTTLKEYPMESNSLPPVVTAITSSQFYQLQGLVHHIMQDIKPHQPDLQLIVFDLGLYSKERMLLEKHCHCEVRDLDFQSYPTHVSSISTFAWRPIILQNMLLEFGSVLYIEPTTRFKNPSSPNYLRMRGSKSFFLWDSLVFTPLVAYTEKDMFKYLHERRCLFQECSLLSSEAIALYRTETTWDEVMKPWLTCALNADCICPYYALQSGCFEIRSPRTTGCHRYDMSALSIILNRGSQYTIGVEKMVSFRLTYSTVEETVTFPEQPWSYKQIILLILTPFLVVIAYKILTKIRRGRRIC